MKHIFELETTYELADSVLMKIHEAINKVAKELIYEQSIIGLKSRRELPKREPIENDMIQKEMLLD